MDSLLEACVVEEARTVVSFSSTIRKRLYLAQSFAASSGSIGPAATVRGGNLSLRRGLR